MPLQPVLNTALDTTNPSTQESFLADFLSLCKENFGEKNFDKWLSSLEIFSQSESEVIFSAPSKFVRDWVSREFIEIKSKNTLLSAAKTLLPKIKKISVIYIQKAEDDLSIRISNPEKKIINLSKHDNVFAFGTELNSRFTFENFVNAKYNRLALSMAKIAAGLDAQIDLFDDKIPLFIHGNVGMGKTHLAQAIAWHIKEAHKGKKVVYLSAEKFMYHFVQSIRKNDVMSFKEQMRSIDVLIVDDVQFIAGKESTQQEFMNCFNALFEENKQVVLVCDRCPSDLENIDEKLKSRISGGMILNFTTPNYQDRVTVLKAKAERMELNISEEIVSFMAEKITTSIRDLEGALKKLAAQQLFLGTEITIDSVKTILLDYIRTSNSKVPTIEKIQKAVSKYYNIKTSDLISSNRSRAIARPRQIAMYLAKSLTSNSLPKIGKEFGNKNHATVIHSVKLISEMMNADSKILQEVKTLEEGIRNN